MPTPFYHLNLAEELRCHPALTADVRAWLADCAAEFSFGNTAADVQTISGQSRQETHFFEIPLRLNARRPWDELLSRHPGLASARQLARPHAAFLAGYLCHLQADYIWVGEIFIPYFGLRSQWDDFPRRIYLHNVLRAYLDREILPGLQNGMGDHLAGVVPQAWLPFAQDEHLQQWRNLLTEQLRPGAQIRTAEVFAARQGIPVEAYQQLLGSEERMQEEVFAHLPPARLKEYRELLIAESISLLNAYLAG